MPDCEFTQQGVEWDPQLFADKRRYKEFNSWLKSLIRYWRNKDGKNKEASVEALRAMRDVLRPDVEAVIPLYAQLDTAHDRIDTLTDDQLNWVDVVEANPRVLCSGGAGTGKTFLAIELARRWTSKGLNVALVCKPLWLKSFLQSQYPIAGLTVSTVDGMASAKRRQGIDYFNAVIVDEGQDLLDMDSIDKIDQAIKNGLSDGQWCFFHDINNQSGLLGDLDLEAFDYLKALNPAKVPLNTNCRNTRVILETIKTSLGADMGVRGAGEGPDIHVVYADSKEEAVMELSRVIDEVIKIGGLSLGQLTLLSPYEYKESIVSELPGNYKQNIQVLDEYSFRKFPAERISFSTIANFKGLENEAIVVVDLVSPDKCEGDLVNHYVGMSRAKSYLAVIWDGIKMQESMLTDTRGISEALESTLNEIMTPVINKLVDETSEGNQKALEGLLAKFMDDFGTQCTQQRAAMESASEKVNDSIAG
ncbi:MAG: hypothetical protein ABGX41_03490, partial [Pseudohongiella sp.]